MSSKRPPRGGKPAGNSKKTAPGRPFTPGVSGNPSGRPKLTLEQRTANELIKALTPAAVVELAVLGGITDRPPARSQMVQFLALKAIADKGLSNAPTKLGGDDSGNPIPLLLRLADERLRNAAPAVPAGGIVAGG